MRKFFIVIGILFIISLVVTICTGNITWKNVKDTSVTVKESFIKTSKAVNETSVKIKDTIVEKFQQVKDNLKKDKQ
jgi:cytochrome c biogenesis protein ResB